jgi:aspartate kinase
VSLTIDNAQSLEIIRAEIETFADVSVEGGQSILCLVGEGIGASRSVAARTFAALNGVKTRMISQGASQLNLSLVVDATDVTQAVESLHREFFQ